MKRSLKDFSVLTFDCYGTLIDWETGIRDALQPLLMRAGSDAVTRSLALELFARAESVAQAATPDRLYPELLADVHRTLARELGLATDRALDAGFGESVPHWPAFADTADALRVLRRHYRLVILSNVDRAGFEASRRKLGVGFDAIYTAEDIGSYKPDPANFAYLLAHLQADLGVGAGAVLHTAQSLFHDHVPAQAAGLACAWIDRQGLEGSERWGATARVEPRPTVEFRFPTLASMAEAVAGGSP